MRKIRTYLLVFFPVILAAVSSVLLLQPNQLVVNANHTVDVTSTGLIVELVGPGTSDLDDFEVKLKFQFDDSDGPSLERDGDRFVADGTGIGVFFEGISGPCDAPSVIDGNKYNIVVLKSGDKVGETSWNSCNAILNEGQEGHSEKTITVSSDGDGPCITGIRGIFQRENGEPFEADTRVTIKDEDGNIIEHPDADDGQVQESVNFVNRDGEFSITGIEPGRYSIRAVWLGDPSDTVDADVSTGSTRQFLINKTVRVDNCERKNFGTATSDPVDLAVDPLEEPPEEEEEESDPENCKGGTGIIDGFLGFIICPLVEGVLGVIHWAETNIIIPFLAINPLDNADDNPVYVMWQIVRNIAYVFLVIAFMYLIFAETTSVGGEAYQLKRLAPRLVIVAIALALSYTIIGIVIDVFNLLGVGIAQLTATILQQTGQTTLVTVDGGRGSIALIGLLAGTGALALVGVLLSGALAAPFIGLAAAVGVFIVLAVVVTIMVRQIMILGLVMIAPIAIVSALLPNTEKFFQMWWSWLTKALMMYPLIMLMFAAGKIFGALIHTDAFASAGAGDDALKSLLGFVANVAPMAMIPFAFKMSGSAIGGIWGAMRGAISKGRQAALGSEHDPHSLRNKSKNASRRRFAVGGRFLTRKIAGANPDETTRRGRARMKAAGVLTRMGNFDQRLAEAEKSEATRFEDLLGRAGGEGSKWYQTGGHDISGEHLMSTTGYTSPAHRAAIDGFVRKTDKRYKQGVRASAGEVGMHIYNARQRGKQYGRSRLEAGQLASGLQEMRRFGEISEYDANEIAFEFAKSAKGAGNETLALLDADWWKAGSDDLGTTKGSLLEQEEALAHNVARFRTEEGNVALHKITGGENAIRSESDFDVVRQHIQQRGLMALNMGSIEAAERAGYSMEDVGRAGRGTFDEVEEMRMKGFLDKASSNEIYNNNTDADTMHARQQLFDLLGYRGRGHDPYNTPGDQTPGGTPPGDDGGGAGLWTPPGAIG